MNIIMSLYYSDHNKQFHFKCIILMYVPIYPDVVFNGHIRYLHYNYGLVEPLYMDVEVDPIRP